MDLDCVVLPDFTNPPRTRGKRELGVGCQRKGRGGSGLYLNFYLVEFLVLMEKLEIADLNIFGSNINGGWIGFFFTGVAGNDKEISLVKHTMNVEPDQALSAYSSWLDNARMNESNKYIQQVNT
nr:hypothetical protein Iba_chr11fCG4080 [Ipomoea batatas]